MIFLVILSVCYAQWLEIQPGGPPYLSSGPLARPELRYGGNLWCHGGTSLYLFAEHMWKYETDTHRWLWQPPAQPSARRDAARWVVRDTLYLAGGTSLATNATLSDMWEYSVETRDFSTLPTPGAQVGVSATWAHEVASKLYLWANGTLRAFDLSTRAWQVVPTTGAPAPVVGARPGAATRGNVAYVYNGAELWTLDLTTFVWAKAQTKVVVPPPRSAPQLWTLGDSILMYGGVAGAQLYTDTWAYSPVTASWQRLYESGPPPYADYAGCVDQQDGNFLLVGAEAAVWKYGPFTVKSIFQLIEWKLDSATIAATVAAVMSSLVVGGLGLILLIMCIGWCRSWRRARGAAKSDLTRPIADGNFDL